MADIARINPQEARNSVQAGKALFVCAYENDDMCKQMRLEGALTLGELNSRLPSLTREQEIVFYCK